MLQRRYVFGPGTNEPIVQYEGSGTTTRYWLHSDERGSIVAMSDGSGNAILKNSYDEYGKPSATNAGRFLYTGQMYVSEAAAYWYKARMYEPALGRFLQTDPIGYDGGMNLYAYAGNDPVNHVDPLGLTYTIPGNGGLYECDATAGCEWHGDITVIASLSWVTGWLFRDLLTFDRPLHDPLDGSVGGGSSGGGTGGGGGGALDEAQPVKAKSPESKKRCRSLVTGGVAAALGAYSIYDVREGINNVGKIKQRLTALDFLKAGSRGASYGGRFGPLAGGGGFVVFAGGLFAWDRYHEQILNWACGE